MNEVAIRYRAPLHVRTDTIRLPHVDDYIPQYIARTKRFYEADLLEYLYFSVPHNGIIVDVGANIGNHTLFFAKYMASAVLALEPHPLTFSMLKWTVARNTLLGVTCIQCAVGREHGVGRLGLPSNSNSNSGCYSLVTSSPTAAVPVTIKPLDDVLATYMRTVDQPVRLIKIDVEGYEEEVLAGGMSAIRRYLPDIVIEAQNTAAFERVCSILAPIGYRTLGRFNSTPTYHFATRGRVREGYSAAWRKVHSALRRVMVARGI